MPQNPQNKIGQTEPKHYNQFISVRTEDLRWLQITTDTGMKLKVETTVKERYQQLLKFVIIDLLKIEPKNTSGQDTITMPMTQIINSFFLINTPFYWN